MKLSKIMFKVVEFCMHPTHFLLSLDRHNIITLPDEMFLKLRFRQLLGYKLNLKNPKTYNEKIQWLKLYDRNPNYAKMVDKYAVKEYVSEIIGDEYIIPTIGVYDSLNEIDFDKLPDRFVMKCTHDSGSVMICEDKKTFDIEKAKTKIRNGLKYNFYKFGREYVYKDVPRRILIEEYLDSAANGGDYKFLCFNGKVKYILVCTERFSSSGLKVTFFDTDWNKMNFKQHDPVSNKDIKKPKNFAKMIELAEKLSNNISFVRVDFYNNDGKIYFGEMTFYPGAGYLEFTPEEWDRKLGDLIKLPNRKNHAK